MALDLLEAGRQSVLVLPLCSTHEMWTYNKLQKSSILLLTALEIITMMQMLVKLELRQSAFGITAGRLCFT